MKKAAPLLATCALLLSLSSAAQYGTPNCKDSCTVTVNLAAGCGSGIRVAPDPITVPRSNTTTITWNIVPADPNGWKFHESKGILIQGLDSYEGPLQAERVRQPAQLRDRAPEQGTRGVQVRRQPGQGHGNLHPRPDHPRLVAMRAAPRPRRALA